MKWNVFMAGYFTFTRRERIGLLVLVLLIIVSFLLPDLVSSKTSIGFASADTAWIAAVKKLEIIETDKGKKLFTSQSGDNVNAYQYDRNTSHSPAAGPLFYFDPNMIDESNWKKLGLRDRTIHTIKNYLSKGGHFYKPEDLKKMYGLRADEYARLEPFIKIEKGITEERPSNAKTEFNRKENEPKRFSYKTIDINDADTSAFIALPGIGSKLALRIVSFREKLGGFYTITQIGEIYGLPDSSFQKIKQYLKLENTVVRKININTATLDDLKAHPYIRYAVAKPIIAYRNEHGPFSRIDDLKKVMAVTDEMYNKISPYLTIN